MIPFPKNFRFDTSPSYKKKQIIQENTYGKNLTLLIIEYNEIYYSKILRLEIKDKTK